MHTLDEMPPAPQPHHFINLKYEFLNFPPQKPHPHPNFAIFAHFKLK